jgi:hypothetical protein
MSRFHWSWIAAMVLALAFFHGLRSPSDEAEMRRAADGDGFVPIFMPDGAPENTVLIFAAANCPQEGAQRARLLLNALRDEGVPARLLSSYQLTSAPIAPDTELRLRRLKRVMEGTVPAVLIGGMGKANPTADEVVSEYRRQQAGSDPGASP